MQSTSHIICRTLSQCNLFTLSTTRKDYDFLDGTWTFNTFDAIRADEVDNSGYMQVHPLVKSGELRLTETFQSLTEFGIFEGGRQSPLTPHWNQIEPLSFSRSSKFRTDVFFPYKADGRLNDKWVDEAKEVADIGLKMQRRNCPKCRAISEYWELGDEFVYPPGWPIVRARDIAMERNFSMKKTLQLIFGISMTGESASRCATS